MGMYAACPLQRLLRARPLLRLGKEVIRDRLHRIRR